MVDKDWYGKRVSFGFGHLNFSVVQLGSIVGVSRCRTRGIGRGALSGTRRWLFWRGNGSTADGPTVKMWITPNRAHGWNPHLMPMILAAAIGCT